MFVGQESRFGLSSTISKAYNRKSLLALGYFIISLGNQKYGVEKSDATMLACAVDDVRSRLANRGRHISKLSELNCADIADTLYKAEYVETGSVDIMAPYAPETLKTLHTKGVIWSPGDEEFDDGSHIYHFDIGSQVRLIGFKTKSDFSIDMRMLQDVRLSSDEFYQTLQNWLSEFEREWNLMPKSDHSSLS